MIPQNANAPIRPLSICQIFVKQEQLAAKKPCNLSNKITGWIPDRLVFPKGSHNSFLSEAIPDSPYCICQTKGCALYV